MNTMKYLIWDFNGTILDDVDVGLKAENKCIEYYKLNRPPLTKQEYLEIFDMPVEDYYVKVGFTWDKFSFEEVGAYWFKWYCALKDEYKVHDGIIDYLYKAHELGYKNILFSASQMQALLTQLDELNIREYFDEVLAMDTIYGRSKIEVGLDWIKDKNKDDCLLIGDTTHDYKAAKTMGIDCILVAKGHQAKHVLEECDCKVVDSVEEIKI